MWALKSSFFDASSIRALSLDRSGAYFAWISTSLFSISSLLWIFLYLLKSLGLLNSLYLFRRRSTNSGTSNLTKNYLRMKIKIGSLYKNLSRLIILVFVNSTSLNNSKKIKSYLLLKANLFLYRYLVNINL